MGYLVNPGPYHLERMERVCVIRIKLTSLEVMFYRIPVCVCRVCVCVYSYHKVRLCLLLQALAVD